MPFESLENFTVDMNVTWMIIGVFVMGFMGILCYGLAVLNQDLEDKREQHKLKTTHTDKTKEGREY